ADLDGDKKPELVAGKRYMGHEGRDPGEYDLLCAYYYNFDPKLKTWSRNEIYFNHRAGFGLDPRAVDVDGDGDIDLVAADRSSLVLFENQRPVRQAVSGSFLELRGPDDYHQKPLLVKSESSFVDARSPAEYGTRRAETQGVMQQVMGYFPDPLRRIPLDVSI